MNNKLIKRVRLPYPVVKGSFEARQNKAAQFTHKVMNNISGTIDDKGISLSKLGHLLKKILPENLAVYTKKDNSPDSFAKLTRTFTNDDTIFNQSLEFKLNKNRKIITENSPSIAHEIRHLADSLYHPKILSREQYLAKKKIDTNKFYNLYNNDVYVMEMEGGKKLKKAILKDIKHKTLKTIRGFSAEDKINLLQYLRYSLISERNSHKTETKFAKKLFHKHKPVYQDDLTDSCNSYMFDEKIKLFTDLTSDIIKKEREYHKTKLKYKN